MVEFSDGLEYPIYFGEEGFEHFDTFLQNRNYDQVFVLVDSNTEEYCLTYFLSNTTVLEDVEILTMDDGEENKNIDIAISIWETLTELGATRKSLMINLGGGVVSDMGGFVSAAFKRGMDFLNVPTTLLNMVDASIGGKTGVDLGALKNQIGFFNNPQLILIDSQFLDTLPRREFLSGFAEIIKYGLTLDKDLWNKIQDFNSLGGQDLEDVIMQAAENKVRVVSLDFKETGLRKVLNFGHTIGHAVESYFLQSEELPLLLHGEAIAIGMICESYLSTIYTGLPFNDMKVIKDFILKYFPKVDIKPEYLPGILEYLKHDKKNTSKGINFSLILEIGNYKLDIYPDMEEIEESIMFYISL